MPTAPHEAARAQAMWRVQERTLMAHGWKPIYIPEEEWCRVGGPAQGAAEQAQQSLHAKMHLLLAVIKQAVEPGSSGGGNHHLHHSGCGCEH
jgi:hypothetical protein